MQTSTSALTGFWPNMRIYILRFVWYETCFLPLALPKAASWKWFEFKILCMFYYLVATKRYKYSSSQMF